MIVRGCIVELSLFMLGACGMIQPLDGQMFSQPGASFSDGSTLQGTNDLKSEILAGDDGMDQLITKWVLKQMPHVYQRNKDWGKQAERWDGIEWDTKGGRIYTKRRKKKVNHGTWRQYSAALLDPQQEFSVRMTNIHNTPDGRLAFQLEFRSKIKLKARQSEWVKGLQLYSLSAEGKASVHLVVDLSLDIQLDPATFPPDLIFLPHAESADIVVSDFRIDRVSKLGGEFAEQVTRLARQELDQEIAKKKIELVQKINKEMDEARDKLRLSLTDAMNLKWAERVKPHLPAQVKKVADPKP